MSRIFGFGNGPWSAKGEASCKEYFCPGNMYIMYMEYFVLNNTLVNVQINQYKRHMWIYMDEKICSNNIVIDENVLHKLTLINDRW